MDASDALNVINQNPLYQTLGIRLTSFGDGEASSELAAPENICWPFEAQPHGGVLFTQIDTTLATAMLPSLNGDYSCATISLDIQFTSRAQAGPFVCRAWTSHRTRNVGFGRAETLDADGEIVAMAQGTFRLIKKTS